MCHSLAGRDRGRLVLETTTSNNASQTPSEMSTWIEATFRGGVGGCAGVLRVMDFESKIFFVAFSVMDFGKQDFCCRDLFRIMDDTRMPDPCL